MVSLLLCAAASVLWVLRINRSRVGNGCRVFASRYTVSLLPDRMVLLGPPPVPKDPVVRKQISEMARSLRAGGGVFWYHGTTGGMGYGGLDFGKTLDPYPQIHFRALDDSTLIEGGELDDATIPTLLTTLEEDRFFLISHALLTYTIAGSSAADDPWMGIKYRLQATGAQSRWTDVYDGVPIDLVKDRPERQDGSWGYEIWAAVTTTATPAERARVRDQWHARLDVPIYTVRYWRVVLLTLGISSAGFSLHFFDRRRRQRRALGVCLACGYDLRASKDRCPECGTPIKLNVGDAP